MKFIRKSFILLYLIILTDIYSQPYIYVKRYLYDSLNNVNSISLFQYNFENSQSNIFIRNADQIDAVIVDNLQKWIFVGQFHSPISVFNCQDTSTHFELADSINWIGRALKSSDDSLIYIFTSIKGNDDIQELLVLNTLHKSIENLLLLPISDSECEEAFFSEDEKIIYFSIEDTIYTPRRADKDKVVYFSTIANQVIKQRSLSEFGYPNSNGYTLHKGRKGISIVHSFFWNETKDSYFRIYNFDNDSGSNFIKYQGYADPYFLDDGKYLILARTEYIEPSVFCTGVFDVYNVSSGKLIKSIYLPSKGRIYTFDNYPNRLYYYLEDENRAIIIDISTIVPKYNLNLNITGNGLITKTPDQTEYDSTSTVVLKAVPSSGNRFNGWSGDTTGTADSIVIEMNSNKNITATFVPKGLIAALKSSRGNLLTGGSLQYYSGGWKDAVNNNNGTFTIATQLKTISLRVTYEYGTQTKSNVTVGTDTIFFQTVNAQVQLKNSRGALIDSGSVQYYSGAWRTLGTTSNGVAVKELLPNNYSFRMTYAFASKDKQQDLNVNPVVVFQTVAANVQLQNSSGNLIDGGTVQYYSGAWRTFGTTTNGAAVKELLPNNYSFRMTYAYASKDKQQDLSVNPVVVFRTVAANVQLQNSSGNLMPAPMGDENTVQYYSGAWRTFGTTTNGVAVKELLPNSYSFRMTYAFASKDKQQNISTNPTVIFQTVATNVQLKNSSGNLIDQGTVQYYSGAWREFGTTSNGAAVKELLPNNYSFRMTYAFASKDKQQDLNSNPTVIFQTVAANVELRNSAGNLITETAAVQYYSGAWREFGTTSNGVATKELLPNNYSFRMTYEFASKDKQQDLSVNPVVVFQTIAANVQLKNSSGNLIDEGNVQYYSGAWRTFGTTTNGAAVKELLPNNYSFRMTYAYASKDKQQDIGSNRTIVFQTVSANVVLQNSAGNPIDPGTVQYYSGAWRDFGATTNGIATKELLPNSYSFRMTYAFASKDKQQDLSVNPIVVFQTVAANVQLQNSSGNLIDEGIVQYYSGAWRTFGTTTNGAAVKELLPNSYSFRMTYEYVSNDKTQDLSANSTVNFNTVLCTIKVKDAQGNPVNDAVASYYSGAWRQIGNTVSGEITKELLPANFTFRIKSGAVQLDKTQNLSTNNIVEFSLP